MFPQIFLLQAELDNSTIVARIAGGPNAPGARQTFLLAVQNVFVENLCISEASIHFPRQLLERSMRKRVTYRAGILLCKFIFYVRLLSVGSVRDIPEKGILPRFIEGSFVIL